MKYPLSLRALHWFMALLIIGLLIVGFYMAGIPDDAANKHDLYPLHKSFGFIALLLVMLRIPTRLTAKVPNPLEGLANWEKQLSHFAHILLYLAMFTMAVSGYFMSATFGSSISLFGLAEVPMIVSKNEYWNGVFHEIHEYAAWLLAGTVILHIAGVIKHRFVDAPGSDVLPRMM